MWGRFLGSGWKPKQTALVYNLHPVLKLPYWRPCPKIDYTLWKEEHHLNIVLHSALPWNWNTTLKKIILSTACSYVGPCNYSSKIWVSMSWWCLIGRYAPSTVQQSNTFKIDIDIQPNNVDLGGVLCLSLINDISLNLFRVLIQKLWTTIDKFFALWQPFISYFDRLRKTALTWLTTEHEWPFSALHSVSLCLVFFAFLFYFLQ